MKRNLRPDQPTAVASALPRYKTRRWTGVLAVAAALTLAGCGGGTSDDQSVAQAQEGGLAGTWEEVLDAADAEGTVIYYSSRAEEIDDELEAAFEQDYPEIDLERFPLGNSTEIVERVTAELEAGQPTADVLWHAVREWDVDMQEDGQVVPLVGPDIAEVASTIPEVQPFGSESVMVYAAPFVMAVNTDRVSGVDAIDAALADPTLNGRIGLPDFTATPSYLTMYIIWEEMYGGEFIQALNSVSPRYYSSSAAAAQAAAAGEVDIAWGLSAGSVTSFDNLEYHVPDAPLTTLNQHQVMAKADNPNAAQVFVNWLVTPTAQQIFADAEVVPIRSDVDSGHDVEFGDVRISNPGDYPAEVLDEARQRYSELFERG